MSLNIVRTWSPETEQDNIRRWRGFVTVDLHMANMGSGNGTCRTWSPETEHVYIKKSGRIVQL